MLTELRKIVDWVHVLVILGILHF